VVYHPAVHRYAIALGLSLLGSFGGLLVASLLLLFGDQVRIKLIPWLISYAVGVLLGVALLDILPQVLEELPASTALGTLLVGILTFFVLEKLVLWRHCHTDECEVHGAPASLVLIGDAFHNFVDGAVIGAAVMTSIPLGVSTAVAVTAHEIPQEVGDFAILLSAGYSRARALWLNLLSGASGMAGALLALIAIGRLPGLLPYLLTFASSSFLYIAMADLIPDLHRGQIDAKAFRQLLLVGAGVLTVVGI
jgi:zinc and cadmium transporter